MYSRPENSMRRPPISLLLLRIASTTDSSGRPYAASVFGSSVTWYCFWKPPTLATSATPGTDCTAYLRNPVLIRADFVGRVLPAFVDERVLVDPADARRVGPELGLHTGGQARLDRRELLEDARALSLIH